MIGIKSIRFFWKIAALALTLGFSWGSEIDAKASQRLTATQIAYLKKRQVPGILKKELDAYFNSSTIQQLIQQLYTDRNAAQEAKFELEQRGFIFVSDKMHVFKHKKFPGYFFKMALPWQGRTEILNASRISYAQKLQAVIKAKKLKIKVPQKWSYFIPIKDAIRRLPQFLVVAQKMNLKGATGHFTSSVERDLKILEKFTGYYDVHDGNVVQCGNHAVIVDTENHNAETIAALHAADEDGYVWCSTSAENGQENFDFLDNLFAQIARQAQKIKQKQDELKNFLF